MIMLVEREQRGEHRIPRAAVARDQHELVPGRAQIAVVLVVQLVLEHARPLHAIDHAHEPVHCERQ